MNRTPDPFSALAHWMLGGMDGRFPPGFLDLQAAAGVLALWPTYRDEVFTFSEIPGTAPIFIRPELRQSREASGEQSRLLLDVAKDDIVWSLYTGVVDGYVIDANGKIAKVPRLVWGSPRGTEAKTTGVLADQPGADVSGKALVKHEAIDVLRTGFGERMHRRWKEPDTHPVDDLPAPRKPAANRGGRPPVHDWEQALIEMAAWVHENGVPEDQSVLTRALHDWFGPDGPSDSEVRRRASKLFARLSRT